MTLYEWLRDYQERRDIDDATMLRLVCEMLPDAIEDVTGGLKAIDHIEENIKSKLTGL